MKGQETKGMRGSEEDRQKEGASIKDQDSMSEQRKVKNREKDLSFPLSEAYSPCLVSVGWQAGQLRGEKEKSSLREREQVLSICHV